MNSNNELHKILPLFDIVKVYLGLGWCYYFRGSAKPKIQTIRKMAALWEISVEELFRAREDIKTMSITKIVITGGPCAGKTTGMSWIQNAFTERGYRVLFISETATELISGGVAPWICSNNTEYQKCQMKLQLEKEKVFEQAARTMDSDKILIVCDRGTLDNKAYMTEMDFSLVLNELGLNEVELRDGYDAVFHLVTAAKGAEKFYTTVIGLLIDNLGLGMCLGVMMGVSIGPAIDALRKNKKS